MLATLSSGGLSTTTNTHVTMLSKVNGGEGFGSDSSFDEEPQVRMRVGEMYQAKVPTELPQNPSHSREGMLIWSPDPELSELQLCDFCETAKLKHQYNTEQALGMLFWHKHDINKSLQDMRNFTPMPDDWSAEDKVLFEQAYNFHGKNFRKIQQLVPDKQIGQLVKHYYLWKNSRLKTSLMDKAIKSRKDHDSENEAMDAHMDYDETMDSDKMQIVEDVVEVKHKLPKGIELSVDELKILAEHPNSPENYISTLEENLVVIKRQVQLTKQESGQMGIDINDLPQPDRLDDSNDWSRVELLLAVKGVRKYGQNHESIANMLGTKSAAQVKTFFSTYKNELNLEEVLKEHSELGNNG